MTATLNISYILGSVATRYGDRLLKTVVSTAALAVAKCFQLLLALISVPLAIAYLGKADYGLLVTITSLVGWLGLADAGIGLGVRNRLIIALARGDKTAARAYVSTGVLSLSLVALSMGAVFAFALPIVPWSAILPVGAQQQKALRLTVCAAGVMALFGLPLNVVRQIYSAEISEHKNAIWTICGSGVGLLTLAVVIKCDLGIVGVALAQYAPPLIAVAVCGLYLFTKDKPWLRPRWQHVSWRVGTEVWTTGGLFLLIQVAMLGIYQASALIISRYLGISHVPDYSIPATLFNYVSLLVSFFVSPFWAAFGEAEAIGDRTWIATHLARLRVLAFFLAGSISLFLVLAGRTIISRLSSGAVKPSPTLLVIMAAYTVLGAVLSPYSMLLNGLGYVKLHALLAIMQASANIALSVILVAPFGITGVAVAALASVIMTSCWTLPLAGHLVLRSRACPMRH